MASPSSAHAVSTAAVVTTDASSSPHSISHAPAAPAATISEPIDVVMAQVTTLSSADVVTASMDSSSEFSDTVAVSASRLPVKANGPLSVADGSAAISSSTVGVDAVRTRPAALVPQSSVDSASSPPELDQWTVIPGEALSPTDVARVGRGSMMTASLLPRITYDPLSDSDSSEVSKSSVLLMA